MKRQRIEWALRADWGAAPRNPASIPAYTGSFSDPVAQAEMNDFAAYVETLRVGLVR
jgi:hypothetical protein